MIKLKSLLKDAHAWERKFGEKLPTLASVQKKKLKEEINKLTEKLSKSDIKKMRDKFNKTGKLPPHLKKLADLMDKHKEVEDIIVPGLEWMNDIPEGVVKKGTQNLNERMGFSEEEYHKRLAGHYQTGIILMKMAQQMDKENRTDTEHKVLHMSLGKYLKMLKGAFKL